MNANVIIIPGSDPFLQQRKLQPKQARTLFDPPNQKRVLVIYWRGAKHGFYDAIVEDIDKNNRLLHKFPVRHEYLAGQRKPLPADTPLRGLLDDLPVIQRFDYLGKALIYSEVMTKQTSWFSVHGYSRCLCDNDSVNP